MKRFQAWWNSNASDQEMQAATAAAILIAVAGAVAGVAFLGAVLQVVAKVSGE